MINKDTVCTFITATVNRSADLGSVLAVLSDFTRGFAVVHDARIATQLPPDCIYLAHEGHCDCDTHIGRGDRHLLAQFAERDLQRLLRKGWTQARIERWKEQRLQAVEKQRQYGIPLVRWVESIRSVVLQPTVTTFGLLHHFYSTNVEQESFSITIEKPMSIWKLDEQLLACLPEDTLREFRR